MNILHRMKKGIALILTAITLTAAVTTTVAVNPVTVEASTKSTTWTKAEKAYKSYMKKFSGARYKIVDIDGNKVPELLAMVSGKRIIYTYSNNKMKKLYADSYGSNNFLCYRTSVHAVVLGWGSYSDAEYKLAVIKGNKLKIVHTYHSYNNVKGLWKESYTMDGKKISKAAFTKFYKVLYGNCYKWV